jgi:isopentenyl phosphate kinase
MSEIVILKIGGSVLTDKNKVSAPRPDEIARMAREISDGKNTKLVLIHGAGSFGHHQAKEYRLKDGLNDMSIKGILPTHNAVKALNKMILDALHINGVDSLPVHPLSSCVLRDGRIEHMCVEAIELMLEHDIVPVLHGDVAMDATRGEDILSGDQLVGYLARALNAKRVGIGTNVDGVYDEQQQVIRSITPASFETIKKALTGSSGVDVTGGMYGKIMELMKLADAGIPSQVFNAETPGNITGFLKNKLTEGTFIRGE